MKLSSALAATDELGADVEGIGSLIEDMGGFVVGFAIGTPLVIVRRGGGGGASASALPRVAARCLRNITMGTTSAAEEKASYHVLNVVYLRVKCAVRRTRATGTHLGMGFLFLSLDMSTPKIGL